MIEYNLPKRKFAVGDKKMISWRLHEKLLEELDKVAKENGWTVTDFVTAALDQAVTHMREQGKKK